MIKKARRMAAEFQTHVDEMVREANLDEVRSQINQIRNFDIKGEVERAVDPDGSLRGTLATNPLAPTPSTSSYGTEASEAAVGEHAATVIETPEDADLSTHPAEAPHDEASPAAGGGAGLAAAGDGSPACAGSADDAGGRAGIHPARLRDTPTHALTEAP